MTVWIVFDAEGYIEEIFETKELAQNYAYARANETGWPDDCWFIREWTVRGKDY